MKSVWGPCAVPRPLAPNVFASPRSSRQFDFSCLVGKNTLVTAINLVLETVYYVYGFCEVLLVSTDGSKLINQRDDW